VIIGLGVDLAEVAPWAEALSRPEAAALQGTFTAAERATCRAGPTPEGERLAARFAAKEAFIKAISSARFGQPPLLSAFDLREIEVVHDTFGRPALQLHGRAAQVAEALGLRRCWLSLSHEAKMATATVILEG
jgi:holo-[acyl-carrier protein] synthase